MVFGGVGSRKWMTAEIVNICIYTIPSNHNETNI